MTIKSCSSQIRGYMI